MQSSKLDVDRQMEKDLRRKMLLRNNSKAQVQRPVLVERDTVMEDGEQSFASEGGAAGGSETMDEEELADVEEEIDGDSDDFAKRVGLHEDAIEKINMGLKEAAASEEVQSALLKDVGGEEKRQNKNAGRGGKSKGKDKVDDAVDENRRRSARVNTEAHTLDKAVDLARKKNLEEEKATKVAGFRGQNADGGGI